MRWPMAVSQGQRSSSVRGVPAAIFFTLAMGCRESPSTKGTPSRSASPLAMVVLPDPATPITTIKGLLNARHTILENTRAANPDPLTPTSAFSSR